MNSSSSSSSFQFPYANYVTPPLLITRALLILLPSLLNSAILLFLIYKKGHRKPLSVGLGAISVTAILNSLLSLDHWSMYMYHHFSDAVTVPLVCSYSISYTLQLSDTATADHWSGSISANNC